MNDQEKQLVTLKNMLAAHRIENINNITDYVNQKMEPTKMKSGNKRSSTINIAKNFEDKGIVDSNDLDQDKKIQIQIPIPYR